MITCVVGEPDGTKTWTKKDYNNQQLL